MYSYNEDLIYSTLVADVQAAGAYASIPLLLISEKVHTLSLIYVTKKTYMSSLEAQKKPYFGISSCVNFRISVPPLDVNPGM